MTAAAIVGEPPQALSDVAAEYRQWHCWAGIPSTGLLYARLIESCPPLVVSSGTPDGLRYEIRRAQQELPQ
jgi:hypothetical protein